MNPWPESEPEWQAQEAAREAQRRGEALPHDREALQQRRIAQALAQPAPAPLPMDFAASVARVAQARDAAAQRLESTLVALLLLVLAVLALRMVSVYGHEWLESTRTLLNNDAGPGWIVLVAVCLGLTGAVQRRRVVGMR